MRLNRESDALQQIKLVTEIADDFLYYTDATTNWTKAVGSGGGAAITAGGTGGILALTTGGTQNIFGSIASTVALFKFLPYRPMYFEVDLQYAEAATNQCAIAVGFSSVITTSLLTNTTGVPNSSMSAALIYKQTGDTNWRAITSNSTTQTLNQSVQTTQPSPTTLYQTLRIECRDVDGTNTEVTFFCNDAPLLDTNTHRPIKQIVSQTSAAAMYAVLMVKNVGGANSETLNIDYVYCNQGRLSSGDA